MAFNVYVTTCQCILYTAHATVNDQWHEIKEDKADLNQSNWI